MPYDSDRSLDDLDAAISARESDVYKRIMRLQKLVYAGICTAFLLSTVCLLSVAWAVYHSNHKLAEAVDISNQTLACFVKGQYDRSVKGLPSNAYYKSHPDELQAALDSIHAQRIEAIKSWGVCHQLTGGTNHHD